MSIKTEYTRREKKKNEPKKKNPYGKQPQSEIIEEKLKSSVCVCSECVKNFLTHKKETIISIRFQLNNLKE